MKKIILVSFLFVALTEVKAQQIVDPYLPDPNPIPAIEGWNYVWGDEFNYHGTPNAKLWGEERGFIRGEEVQYYQMQNAMVKDGRLLIEGKKERKRNEFYDPSSTDYRKNTEFAEYTSASIMGKNKREFLFGRIEVRAKIDSSGGNFPAIWTCGINKPWPENGEIDIMEYYWTDVDGKMQPAITANFAVGTGRQYDPHWKSTFTPITYYLSKDPDWMNKYHVWRMDWTPDRIDLYLDDELRNSINVHEFKNSDGSITFHNPQFMILNLAIRGDRAKLAHYPTKFEVDYFRVYQKMVDQRKPTSVKKLQAVIASDGKCILQWKKAKDNFGIYRYDIYKNGNADEHFIGSVERTSFELKSDTYTSKDIFTVKALDKSGNYSEERNVKCFGTP